MGQHLASLPTIGAPSGTVVCGTIGGLLNGSSKSSAKSRFSHHISPVEEAHDLTYAPNMTEGGYKPFLQARSDDPSVYSLVKVVRGEEDFLIFVAWYSGAFYHFKKYKVDTYGHVFNIFTKETESLAETLGYGVTQ